MAATGVSRKFQIGGSTVEVGAATAADVLTALAGNQQFPKREIDLAHVSLEAEQQRDIEFNTGKGKVSLAASGSARLQMGIFDSAVRVIETLALEDGATVGLELADQPGTRMALFLAGYDVEGAVSGSHPIGVVGSVSFGVKGARGRTFAVVHRFPEGLGARNVLADLFGSVRLPRQVASPQDLTPGTLLVTEVEGSLAVKVGAQLGYDFSFVREAKAIGLTGDIGLKLETGVKATLGFEVSGRYLIALERPGDEPLLRLRLFKLSHKGWDFGLNLSAKATTVVELPENVDDLVKAVFGLHGQQIIRDLHAVESKWLSKDTDLSDTVAALTKKTGLALIEKTTGVAPAAGFEKARGILMSAIEKWEQLPSKVSAFLWAELESGGLKGQVRKDLEAALKTLAGTDAAARKELVTSIVSRAGFEDEALGKLLITAGDRGLAALIDRSDEVKKVAQTVLDVLDGGVIERLQKFVAERLNLDSVIDIVKETDFQKLDQWLVQRLSLFLDKKLGFDQLEEVKTAVRLVLEKRHEIYAKARQALNNTYEFDLAVKYQSATTKTALLDIQFDDSKPACELLKAIVSESDYDRVLVETVKGVVLNKAVLTHAVERKRNVQVNMPFYSSETETLTESLGRVTALEEGGRVLFYELESSDTRTVRNRLKSQISLSAAIPIPLGSGVRMHAVRDASWAYQIRTVRPNVRRAEFEARFAPILGEFFGSRFAAGGQSSISTFITDLDRTVEEQIHNGSDEFGDVLASLELSVPASVMAAWFQPREAKEVRQAARAVSRRIQSALRRVLPYFYFQNLDRLMQNSEGSPLLVWSALPVINDFRLSGGAIVASEGVFWDVFDPEMRRFMVSRPETVARLGGILATAKRQLEAAGRQHQASFFGPSEIRDFLGDPHVQTTENRGNFLNLLSLESRVSQAVEDALRDIQKFHNQAESRPSKAIASLAKAGEDLTSAFHSTLSSVYGGETTRVLGSMLFVEGACALDPALTPVRPTAVLGLTVLREERTFVMSDFLANKRPPPEDIALEQRLVASGGE